MSLLKTASFLNKKFLRSIVRTRRRIVHLKLSKTRDKKTSQSSTRNIWQDDIQQHDVWQRAVWRKIEMNSERQEIGNSSPLLIRPVFLECCEAFIAAIILPYTIKDSYLLQRGLLLLAAIAILIGWILLLVDGFPRSPWRKLITLITSTYLIISIPVFMFEMSQMRWFMRSPHHIWWSLYARPWVHWGYIFIFSSIFCSFFGKGWARVGFITGAVLLMVNWSAMSTWVY